MPDIQRFLQDLSSAEPVPGGGSVAALQVALGASLVAMVANLTIGKKKYAVVQEQAVLIRDRASSLRDRAYALVQEDADAYRAVSEALSLPRTSEEEKCLRRARVQQALKCAAEPPLAVMQLAREVIGLASELVQIGNRSAVSDVGVAALAARCGLRSAWLNVETNLAAVSDEDWELEFRHRSDAVRVSEEQESRIMDVVLGVIGGSEA